MGKGCRRDLDRDLIPVFGQRALRVITSDLVVAWLRQLTEDGYSPAMLHRLHGLLTRVLAAAVRSGRLNVNPCANTKSELPRLYVKEFSILTRPEAENLLIQFDDDRDRLMVMLGRYAGLRWSQMHGLRTGRVGPSSLQVASDQPLPCPRTSALHRPGVAQGRRQQLAQSTTGRLRLSPIAAFGVVRDGPWEPRIGRRVTGNVPYWPPSRRGHAPPPPAPARLKKALTPMQPGLSAPAGLTGTTTRGIRATGITATGLTGTWLAAIGLTTASGMLVRDQARGA